MTVSCFVQQRHRPIKCWQKWPCMFSRPHLKRPKLFPAYLTVYCWDGDSVSDSFKSNIERGQGANPTQYTRITSNSKKTSHQLSTLHNAKTNLHHHHEPNSKLAFRNFIRIWALIYDPQRSLMSSTMRPTLELSDGLRRNISVALFCSAYVQLNEINADGASVCVEDTCCVHQPPFLVKFSLQHKVCSSVWSLYRAKRTLFPVH